MNIAEYSPLRAAVLNKTSFPESEFPLNLKILWIELVDKAYMNNNILKGLHQHSFFEIHFVFSGNVSYSCGGEILISALAMQFFCLPKRSIAAPIIQAMF